MFVTFVFLLVLSHIYLFGHQNHFCKIYTQVYLFRHIRALCMLINIPSSMSAKKKACSCWHYIVSSYSQYLLNCLSFHVLQFFSLHDLPNQLFWNADPPSQSSAVKHQEGPAYSETVLDGDSHGNWPQSPQDWIMSSCLPSHCRCIKVACAF